MNLVKPYLIWLALFMMLACNDSSFKPSAAPSAAPEREPEPIQADIDFVESEEDGPVVDDLGALTDTYAVSLKVDIVFAIDTSASMNDEIAAVEANLGNMLATLNNGRLDAYMHLLMEDTFNLPPTIDANKFAYVQQQVGSSNAISRLTGLFNGLYAASYRDIQNMPLATPLAFRNDAKKEVVVISDDNGSGEGNLAVDFDPNNTLKATFNAIVGLPTSVENDTCDVSGIGTEYIQLANQSKGSMLDLCSPDWTGLIKRLSDEMVKRSVTFTLSQVPNDAEAIIVFVEEQKMEREDWMYDAENNVVTLLKTDMIKDGSNLSINYNPATM
ncbi:MAG: hypothetical protein ACOH5I_22990 [Oligoflexus sp.]